MIDAGLVEVSGTSVSEPTFRGGTLNVVDVVFREGERLNVSFMETVHLFVSEITIGGMAPDAPSGVATEVPPMPGAEIVASFGDRCPTLIGIGWSDDGEFLTDQLLVTVTPPDRPDCPCEVGGDPERVDIIDLLTYIDAYLDRDERANFQYMGINIASLFAYVDCWLDASRTGGCP